MNAPSAARRPAVAPSPTPIADFAVAEAPAAQLPAVADQRRQVPSQPAVPAVQLSQAGVASIAKAIASVMRGVGTVHKAGRHEFHKYDYARMEDILQRVTPLLADNGLVIIPSEVSRSLFDNDAAVMVTYQYTIIHESGEVWPERPVWTGLARARDSKGGFDDKTMNKCATGAQKYFLKALLHIPTSDGDDADAGPPKAPPASPRPSASGKVEPHTIPTAGEKFETWAPKYMAALSRAESSDDLTRWDQLNAAALDTMHDKSPDLYKQVEAAAAKRQQELSAQQRSAARPAPTQPEPPPADLPADAAATLTVLADRLAECGDKATLDETWESMAAAINDLPRKFRDDAAELYEKNLARVA